MELSEEQINEIVEGLESGIQTFVNIESKKIMTILEWDEFTDAEFWETMMREIEENPDKFLQFQKMNADQGFQILEEFVETIDDEKLKRKLETGLRQQDPFENFKIILENNNTYKQKWIEFKHARYVAYVKEQLAVYNKTIDGKFYTSSQN